MANGTDLDEIRAILAEVARSQAQTQQIVASTARAVEANSNAITDLQDGLALTRNGIDDAVEMITSISRESAEERQELSQQIQVLIDESRQNTREHEDFRSFIRGLQMEVRRIWERVSGNNIGEA